MGKEDFIRNTLRKLHSHGMFKKDLVVSEEDEEEGGEEGGDEMIKQFGIVILPENGAPCGDIVTSYSGEDSDPDRVITDVLRVRLFLFIKSEYKLLNFRG